MSGETGFSIALHENFTCIGSATICINFFNFPKQTYPETAIKCQ